jgi:4-amino-4-deoxy-L-arabinose transferase-like glycosyltransferase
MSTGRLWLAVVLACFCLPLFVGLGRGDVQDDEAIYTFAVDRILETGNWLEPKSIPNEDWAFLEKPPLKFWIVAAPIRLGLLPHDEFGYRFWDALFGAMAFVYVFLIGCRLIGPACGVVAVLVLFAHDPLLFAHGLRSNNMEAPLVLAYCGGAFHYLEWARRARGLPGRPAPGHPGAVHAAATGLYFILGFMTKFVAVLFLPVVLGLASLAIPADRRALLRHWRVWLWVGLGGVVLTAPWFIWATFQYGWFLWEMMVGAHVVTRFTSYVDPTHVQPWFFYPVTLYRRFSDSGAAGLVLVGLAALLVTAIRRRSFEGLLVVLWFVVPVLLMSVGTSKLYHYAYPVLPPLALSAGYVAALVLMLAPVPLNRALERLDGVAFAHKGIAAALRRPAVRAVLLAIAAVAITIALASLVFGTVRVDLGRFTFRSTGVLRPIVLAVVCGVLGGATRGATRAVVAVLVVSALPLPAYRQALTRLDDAPSPIRTARDCVLDVQRQVSGPGLYVDTPAAAISHPMYYYLRRVRPWTRTEAPAPVALGRYLDDPAQQRPILVWEPTYREYWRTTGAAEAVRAGRTSPPMVVLSDIVDNVFLLLPGPYAVCSPDAAGRG